MAENALDNFPVMVQKMDSIANGNDPIWSRHWSVEEGVFPPLRDYVNKNKVLMKELNDE